MHALIKHHFFSQFNWDLLFVVFIVFSDGVYLGDLDLTPPYSLSPDAKNGDVFRCSVAGEFAGRPMNVGDLGTLIFNGADCLITPNYTVIGSMINDALSTSISTTITENIANAITASVEVDGEVDLAITNKITTSVQTGGEIEQAITNAVTDNREKLSQTIYLTNEEDGNTFSLAVNNGNGGHALYLSTTFIVTDQSYINAINVNIDHNAFLDGDILSIKVDTSTFGSGGQIGTLSITTIGNVLNPITLTVLSGVELYLSFAIVKVYEGNAIVFLGSNARLLDGSPAQAVTSSQILNAVDNTTLPLTSNEVNILINDTTDRTELIFYIGDELFIDDIPVRITVDTNANITSLQFNYGGRSLVQTVTANQNLIFVFQRRGDFFELMSKTVMS